MKKIFVLTLTLFAFRILFSQACVTTAYMANESGNYQEAVQAIEECLLDPKATAKEKYWRYRAAIYINVAKDAELSKQYPNALMLSRESVTKAMELDLKKDYEGDNKGALLQIQMLANNGGIDLFNAGD